MSLNTARLTLLPSQNGHRGFPEGYWRQQVDHPDEWYKVRPIDYEYRDRLYEKYSRVGRNGLRELKGQRAEEFWKDLMDYLIEDWEIYEDAEQEHPVPCNRDTKYGLHVQYKTRSDWVWEESVALKEDDDVRRQAEEQNFRRARAHANGAAPELSAVSGVLREG